VPRPDNHYAVCDCCGLEYPAWEALPWHERRKARRLKVLEDAADEPAGAAKGPYRDYWVKHEHRVCPACYEHLQAGGQFRALKRNKTKLAFLMVVAVVALLIALSPILLPHLISALWLAPGEGGR